MKKQFFFIVKFLILIAIIFYIQKNNQLIFGDLINIDKFYILLVLVLLGFITVLLSSFRFYLILQKTELKVSYFKALNITLIGNFFNNVLFGAYGGDLVKIYYLASSSHSKKIFNSISILVDRVYGLIGLGIITLFFFFIDIRFNQFIFKFINNQVLLFFSLFSLLFIVIIFTFSKKILKLEYLNYFRVDILFSGILISISIFLILNYMIYVISHNYLNIYNDVKLIFFSNSISNFLSVIPITPGGLGIAELTFSEIINFFNDKVLVGLANVIIIFRIISLIISLPGGIIYLFVKSNFINR